MPKRKKPEHKTRMYHFRIDPNDEREAGAESILLSYISDEVGVREVVTAALYALEGRELPKGDNNRLISRQFKAMMGELEALHIRLNEISVIRQSGQMTPEIEQEEMHVNRRLQQNVAGLISPQRSYDE
jgi:hypothetical protein